MAEVSNNSIPFVREEQKEAISAKPEGKVVWELAKVHLKELRTDYKRISIGNRVLCFICENDHSDKRYEKLKDALAVREDVDIFLESTPEKHISHVKNLHSLEDNIILFITLFMYIHGNIMEMTFNPSLKAKRTLNSRLRDLFRYYAFEKEVNTAFENLNKKVVGGVKLIDQILLLKELDKLTGSEIRKLLAVMDQEAVIDFYYEKLKGFQNYKELDLLCKHVVLELLKIAKLPNEEELVINAALSADPNQFVKFQKMFSKRREAIYAGKIFEKVFKKQTISPNNDVAIFIGFHHYSGIVNQLKELVKAS